MGMHTLPLLDKNQALFDWADHPNSYNALKPGTPTKEFHRTAWNWLAFTLQAALLNAGLEWDAKYTTYSGALIQDPETKLTAWKFNSVSHNVDRLFPIVWGWASDPEHRGYVGRLEFHGRSQYGKECDKVYPEYILELVEKVNFLIELMRGTWPTKQGVGTALAPMKIKAAGVSNKALVSPTNYRATAAVYGGGIAAKGVAIDGQALTTAEVQTGAEALLGLPSGGDSRSYSSHNIGGNILPAAMAEAGCQVFSIETADADKHQSIIGAAQEMSASKSQAEVMSNLLAFVDAFYRVPLWEMADVEACPAGILDAEYLADGLKQARPQVNPALAGAAYYRAIGKQTANTEDLPGAFIMSEFSGRTKRQADADTMQSRKTVVRKTSKSDTYMSPEKQMQMAFYARKTGETAHLASPEVDLIVLAETGHKSRSDQQGGGELIPARFAGASKVSAVRNWTGLEKLENLQVTASARSGIRKLAEPVSNTSARVATKHRSGSSVRCALDFMIPESAWYDPVQRGSDLYIRSVYSTWTDGSKLNIDTAFFLEPVQEGSNLHIRMDIIGGE